MSIVGQTFGNWSVIQELPASNYICRCNQCGNNLRKINGYFLRNGKAPKCECLTGKATKGSELIGRVYGTFKIVSCSGRDNYIGQCVNCGYYKDISKKDLELGSIPECRNHTNTPVKIDLGIIYGDWSVLSKSSGGKYTCRCRLCGKERDIVGWNILNNAPKCDCKKVDMEDELGKVYDTWKLMKYLGTNKYMCQCVLCGNTKDIDIYYLRRDKAPLCECRINEKYKNNKKPQKSLVDEVFDTWKVISYDENSYYNCACINCGNKKRIHAYKLKTGAFKSCDCTGNISLKGLSVEQQKQVLSSRGATKVKPATDLTGKTFGYWSVLGYAGANLWECKCNGSCNGTLRLVSAYDLTHGKSTSCGCYRQEKIKQATLEKFGVENYSMLNSTITSKQRELLQDKEKLKNYILSFDEKPTMPILIQDSKIHGWTLWKYIHSYGLDIYLSKDKNDSKYELELYNLFGGERRNRTVLNGQEVDLLYKNKRFGIEFNGDYWHSEIYKESDYHQNKSVKAFRSNIYLLQIFEHEWCGSYKNKLIGLIKNVLYNTSDIGENYSINNISESDSIKFIEKYSINKSNIVSTPNSLRLGLIHNNELIAIMLFNRINSTNWEIPDIVWNFDYNIYECMPLIFNYFIKNINPICVVSYADISKYVHNIYGYMGFKIKSILKPTYIWYNMVTKQYVNKCNTTDTNMYNDGYCKIYDCGRFEFIWEA